MDPHRHRPARRHRRRITVVAPHAAWGRRIAAAGRVRERRQPRPRQVHGPLPGNWPAGRARRFSRSHCSTVPGRDADIEWRRRRLWRRRRVLGAARTAGARAEQSAVCQRDPDQPAGSRSYSAPGVGCGRGDGPLSRRAGVTLRHRVGAPRRRSHGCRRPRRSSRPPGDCDDAGGGVSGAAHRRRSVGVELREAPRPGRRLRPNECVRRQYHPAAIEISRQRCSGPFLAALDRCAVERAWRRERDPELTAAVERRVHTCAICAE